MTRLAPLVGSDITQRCFLPRYAIMCSDALFHVRKVSLRILYWIGPLSSTVILAVLCQFSSAQ